MNPSRPTTKELNEIESLFFDQMKKLSRRAANPQLAEMGWLQTFELQFSDRWVRT